jgi:hypothetical protein
MSEAICGIEASHGPHFGKSHPMLGYEYTYKLRLSMTREELIAECRRRLEAGEDVETIIRYLRATGCSKIDSIAVLKGACDIGLAKAKETVHFSATWADRKASDEKFHEDIVDALTSEKTRR